MSVVRIGDELDHVGTIATGLRDQSEQVGQRGHLTRPNDRCGGAPLRVEPVDANDLAVLDRDMDASDQTSLAAL